MIRPNDLELRPALDEGDFVPGDLPSPTEREIAARDGTRLFVRRYRPRIGTDAAATVFVVHGASEHGGRYGHVARFLAARGFDVVVPDQRGHGRSGGTPTHVARFGQYVDDLDTIRRACDPDPRRTAVIGHSMGGLVSARFAQTHAEQLVALVMLAPLLGVKVAIPWSTLAAGKLLSWVAPRTRFQSRVDPGDTCRDAAVVAARELDPLLHRSVTARWFYAMKGAVRAAWRDAPTLRTPLLVLQGMQDRIVDPDATANWFDRCGSFDKTLRRLPDHRHELHNEPDWRTTLALVADWLTERFANETSATDSGEVACAISSPRPQGHPLRS